MSISELINHWSANTARTHLTKCCASHHWVDQMVGLIPFEKDDDVTEAASQVWFSLSKDDWLEAFQGHSKIGDLKSLKKKYSSTKAWSEGEQGGVSGASDETLLALKSLNEEYEQKFGFIFIVCATNKSADEMLTILKSRIDNSYDEELKNAAQEQDKITRIRLEKLQ